LVQLLEIIFYITNIYRETYITSLYITRLCADNNLLHIASTEYGFWENDWDIYDITNPNDPDLIFSEHYGVGYDLADLAINDEYVFITGSGGYGYLTKIYNINDPFMPILVDTDSSEILASKILEIEENIAYIYDCFGDLKIVDI